jgi:hypothetical protein
MILRAGYDLAEEGFFLMKRICGFVIAGALTIWAMGSSVAQAPSPSPMEWGKLQDYAAYLYREKLVAERCQIDLTPATERFTTIRSQFSLSDTQARTLDTDMTACFQRQPPPPPESVDGRVCPNAKRALLELDALSPR